ncbi:inactive leucine-rich repeat receptor-like protein kinase coryne [Phtheirospermum japonicum]|uniref:Inactive leucine-rich repeat receptor-like protein kinase coryne n=1 Tax=Phtheirospermum japonicum TaxID=374723 RepID=A0A830D1S5_9LAMI|nr:inactive leucine-rich repeat receptor-like protein kinase coryne [Phtheirospermum japonicum]
MKCGQFLITKPLTIIVLFIFYLNKLSAQCLDRTSTNISIDPPNSKNRFRSIILSVVLGILTGLICALLFALLLRYFVKYINKTPILKPKDPIVFSPKISRRTLNSALSNEPQLLGLDPKPEAQTKSSKRKRRKIKEELENLARLRHRNLMSLRGYYVFESDGYNLVYDYVSTGSLEDVMIRVRRNELELKWEFRLRIAVGIIKGLHYLHFSCEPRRLHYNLKPSNVMLDLEFEPRLGDCGLAVIFPGFVRVSSGYNAPECFQNSRYTDKSDIFSFGVILGVLLTGRDPLDPFFGEASSRGSLGQWLRHVQQAGEAREALDKSILGQQVEEDEMLMAVRIAVVCLSDLPADRPSSDELVSMLTQLNSF